MLLQISDLAKFRVDPARGFLPSQDPLTKLPSIYEAWDEIGAELGTLLMTHKLRSKLDRLALLDSDRLQNDREEERAFLLLSVFANAYVWADLAKPATRIPTSVAVPLCRLAEKLGRPPIVTHSSIVLHNWRRLDQRAPIDLDNLACLQLFFGGLDETWFYLNAVAIECKGAPALVAAIEGQRAANASKAEELCEHLRTIATSIHAVNATLLRVGEFCDPYIFYHRVRPALTGWSDAGIVYEGVSPEPKKYFGGSAAQSPFFQAIDAALGIHHQDKQTSPYLIEMRKYMTPAHRKFIEMLEKISTIRSFVSAHQQAEPTLCEAYNQCVQALEEFRKKHFEIAVRYITHQAPKGVEAKGTGGTSFAAFLGKSLKETSEKIID
jgi:indoleamine 2,3-dioxygenase